MHPIEQRLTRSRTALLTLLDRLDESTMEHPVSEGWTVRQTLTHLVASEADHRRVAEVFIDGRTDQLPQDFEIDAHNAARLAAMGTRSLDELRDALVAERTRTLQFLNELTDDDLAISGPHPALGTITVEGILRVIAVHEKMHTRDIATALALED